jgi:hypothetical protein
MYEYKMYILYLSAEDNTFAFERLSVDLFAALGGRGRWWGDSMN